MAPTKFNATTAKAKLAALRMGLVEAGASEHTQPVTYDPSDVADLASQLLATSLNPVERLAVREQAFIASLDSGDLRAASAHLSVIEKQFSFDESVRVQRLHGLLAEAHGDFARAVEIYSAALEKDETNVLIYKRVVAVLVSQGKRAEAIEKLVAYVDAFMQDVEGWTELAALYLEENMLPQAQFCFEELLLLRPQNHLYHVRYAEVLYTGGKFELAIKHYCAALELCKDNVRALYGLKVATAAALAARAKIVPGKGSKGGRGSSTSLATKDAAAEDEAVDDETIASLSAVASKRLAALYEAGGKEGATSHSVVKTWLAI
ncbi:ER membrane complex subunit 2 [Geranomyces variabilis]|uniref:ER membrane protein complex subunit 2 n=1 Tax=Geranomyces variabilis TaxID=109894 RepID=A0AAD5XQQ9_9FUNG|nr:ER membrane complex subunit 2 [Geranomyces variabilis]